MQSIEVSLNLSRTAIIDFSGSVYRFSLILDIFLDDNSIGILAYRVDIIAIR